MPAPAPALNKNALKRLHKELIDLRRSDLGGLVLEPNEADMTRWKGYIPGPSGSPYEGGVWEVGIVVPVDYPFKPPLCTFTTPIYHCNVNAGGGICLDILKGQWSPALSLHKVLLSISSLMSEPNEKDPLVGQIAASYKSNRAKHDMEARAHTKLHAMKPSLTNAIKRSSTGAGVTPFSIATGSSTNTNPASSSTTGPGNSSPAIDLSGGGTERSTSTRPSIINDVSFTNTSRPIAGSSRVATSSSVISHRHSSLSNGGQSGPGGSNGTAIDLLDDDDNDDGDGGEQSARRVKRKVNPPAATMNGESNGKATGSGGTNGSSGAGHHEPIEID